MEVETNNVTIEIVNQLLELYRVKSQPYADCNRIL